MSEEDNNEGLLLPYMNEEENSLAEVPRKYNAAKVREQMEEVTAQIVNEEDPNKIKEHVAMFNAYSKKQEALRVNLISDVLNHGLSMINDRMINQPNTITTAEATKILQTTNQLKDSAQKALDSINNMPQITYNQNNIQVNVNKVDDLDRNSRDKLNDLLSKILQPDTEPLKDVAEAEVVEEDNNEV